MVAAVGTRMHLVARVAPPATYPSPPLTDAPRRMSL